MTRRLRGERSLTSASSVALVIYNEDDTLDWSPPGRIVVRAWPRASAISARLKDSDRERAVPPGEGIWLEVTLAEPLQASPHRVEIELAGQRLEVELQEIPALVASIEALYEVFAGYDFEVERDFPSFSYRMSREEVERLTMSVRELGVDDLGAYPGWAITTCGDTRHYKHFLPRMLELWARNEDRYMLHSYVSKLEQGECWSWPAAERLALRRFFAATADAHADLGTSIEEELDEHEKELELILDDAPEGAILGRKGPLLRIEIPGAGLEPGARPEHALVRRLGRSGGWVTSEASVSRAERIGNDDARLELHLPDDPKDLFALEDKMVWMALQLGGGATVEIRLRPRPVG